MNIDMSFLTMMAGASLYTLREYETSVVALCLTSVSASTVALGCNLQPCSDCTVYFRCRHSLRVQISSMLMYT